MTGILESLKGGEMKPIRRLGVMSGSRGAEGANGAGDGGTGD